VLQGKVAVVTGGNSGIGQETAAGLAALGATTVLMCRSTTKGEQAAEVIRRRTGNGEVAVAAVDLADLRSVERGAAETMDRFGRVDVLLNNAGGMWDRREISPQGLDRVFVVNYLGHYLLTRRLLDAMEGSAPSRIVNVSSSGHRQGHGMRWGDLQGEDGWGAPSAYGQAKLAQILFARELARRFGDRGVVAHSVHPGVVRTGFGGDDDLHGGMKFVTRAIVACFGVSPERGARTSVFLATSEEAGRSNGGYWVRCKQVRPSKYARDDQAAQRLWSVSEDLVVEAGIAM
jgi:NAD(P)-dependent dehydrogenase (short-subunit alcohol dehydrogenase family)